MALVSTGLVDVCVSTMPRCRRAWRTSIWSRPGWRYASGCCAPSRSSRPTLVRSPRPARSNHGCGCRARSVGVGSSTVTSTRWPRSCSRRRCVSSTGPTPRVRSAPPPNGAARTCVGWPVSFSITYRRRHPHLHPTRRHRAHQLPTPTATATTPPTPPPHHRRTPTRSGRQRAPRPTRAQPLAPLRGARRAPMAPHHLPRDRRPRRRRRRSAGPTPSPSPHPRRLIGRLLRSAAGSLQAPPGLSLGDRVAGRVGHEECADGRRVDPAEVPQGPADGLGHEELPVRPVPPAEVEDPCDVGVVFPAPLVADGGPDQPPVARPRPVVDQRRPAGTAGTAGSPPRSPGRRRCPTTVS